MSVVPEVPVQCNIPIPRSLRLMIDLCLSFAITSISYQILTSSSSSSSASYRISSSTSYSDPIHCPPLKSLLYQSPRDTQNHFQITCKVESCPIVTSKVVTRISLRKPTTQLNSFDSSSSETGISATLTAPATTTTRYRLGQAGVQLKCDRSSLYKQAQDLRSSASPTSLTLITTNNTVISANSRYLFPNSLSENNRSPSYLGSMKTTFLLLGGAFTQLTAALPAAESRMPLRGYVPVVHGIGGPLADGCIVPTQSVYSHSFTAPLVDPTTMTSILSATSTSVSIDIQGSSTSELAPKVSTDKAISAKNPYTVNGIKAGLSGYPKINLYSKPGMDAFAPHIGWYSDYTPSTPDYGKVQGIPMVSSSTSATLNILLTLILVALGRWSSLCFFNRCSLTCRGFLEHHCTYYSKDHVWLLRT